MTADVGALSPPIANYFEQNRKHPEVWDDASLLKAIAKKEHADCKANQREHRRLSEDLHKLKKDNEEFVEDLEVV